MTYPENFQPTMYLGAVAYTFALEKPEEAFYSSKKFKSTEIKVDASTLPEGLTEREARDTILAEINAELLTREERQHIIQQFKRSA